jgi:phosphopantothenoylcysteine decarboxylase/phosphopantothenate--cysteine ligase
MRAEKRILLVVSGGIAAYKSLELVRRLRQRGIRVRCILTRGGAEFVTPLALGALSEEQVYGDLFSLNDENEMGHIRLSREADLVVVAPATADIMAKMASGIADDLATTALLATDKPVLVAPAMNTRMWEHPATRRNMARLEADGVMRVGPGAGDLACGETGEGRMAEPAEILASIETFFQTSGSLAGIHALVTSGPTQEPIDPVRFIANRSSGKQGHAIARAAARQGAKVTLVSGPTALPDPIGVNTIHVTTAREMLSACEDSLPADVAVCCAAVSDWRPLEIAGQKIKKNADAANARPGVELVENPDILATLAALTGGRPRLVIGFSAETQNMIQYASQKLAQKGCDWILANDVSANMGTFGGDENTVTLLRADSAGKVQSEDWARSSKEVVAERLIAEIATAIRAA